MKVSIAAFRPVLARLVPVAAVMAACVLHSPAHADDPGALLIDAVGEISPALEPFEEIGIGARLTLAPNAEVTISHYGACEEVTVRGGAILIGRSTMQIYQGALLDRQKGDCPQSLELAETDVAVGGVVLRGMSLREQVPLRPQFVISGDPSRFDRLVVAERNETVLSIPVSGRLVAWPDSAPDLDPLQDYSVILHRKGGGKVFSVAVKAEPEAPSRTILRP